MVNVIVTGAQWGDEGKAKITDLLAEQAQLVIRSQGGCNAGHTVVHQGHTYKFHLIPSGILYQRPLCVLGPGVVILPESLQQEIQALEAKGLALKPFLKISNRAHLTLPWHVKIDQARESRLGHQKIGTTGKGIGPTYTDKVSRCGFRVCDLFESQAVLDAQFIAWAKDHWYLLQALPDFTWPQPEDVLPEFRTWVETHRAWMTPYIVDTTPLLWQAHQQKLTTLFEGAQGALLDVDHGTYPFVTSSNAIAGGACTGAGVGPTRMDHTLGVMKAYITRVGAGPFPSELLDETGEFLVAQGHEFGTTTGRKRRCGWFDAVLGRYTVQVNGLDGIALTKLDVLSPLAEIKICVAYRDTRSGELLHDLPASIHTLASVEPVYETLPGWQCSLEGITQRSQLPSEAQDYIQRIENLLETPVDMISTGPDRQETIVVNALLPTLASV